jgi:hypothetical protein
MIRRVACAVTLSIVWTVPFASAHAELIDAGSAAAKAGVLIGSGRVPEVRDFGAASWRLEAVTETNPRYGQTQTLLKEMRALPE